MDEQHPPLADLTRVQADLEQSRADVAAGRTVPLGPVLDRMRRSVKRAESRENASVAIYGND